MNKISWCKAKAQMAQVKVERISRSIFMGDMHLAISKNLKALQILQRNSS